MILNRKLTFLRFAFVLWSTGEFFSPHLIGSEAVRLRELHSHWKAQAHGESCSIYRALEKRTKDELETNQSVLVEREQAAKSHWSALDKCARLNSLEWRSSREGDLAVAEACPTEYASWLHFGFQTELVKQDIDHASGVLASLSQQLLSDCGKGPKSESTAMLGIPPMASTDTPAPTSLEDQGNPEVIEDAGVEEKSQEPLVEVPSSSPVPVVSEAAPPAVASDLSPEESEPFKTNSVSAKIMDISKFIEE